MQTNNILEIPLIDKLTMNSESLSGSNVSVLPISNQNLPNTIENLTEFVLVGREKLKAYQAKVNAIDKLNLT